MHTITDALYGTTAPPAIAYYNDRIEVVTATRPITLQDDHGGSGGTTTAYRYDATVYAPHEYLKVLADKGEDTKTALNAVSQQIVSIQGSIDALIPAHTHTRYGLAYHYASRMKGVNINSTSDINKVPTAVRADVQAILTAWQPSWNTTAP